MANRKNTIPFGMGTIGRDMLYSLVSMFLTVYLTEALNITDGTMWVITAIFVGARIFDAVNDPIMGVIVDNTKSKWSKFKPWITVGAVLAAIFTVLLFTPLTMSEKSYVFYFAFVYILWGISWTINDIAYWSMLPALSTDQKQREKIGAFARICANIGLAVAVVGIPPLSKAIGETRGSLANGYNIVAIGIVILMLVFQSITVIFVKEPKEVFKRENSTSLKGMVTAIFKNDQLLFTAISMSLFMIGYVTTTSFGLYFFKYAYRDEGLYSAFAGIVVLTQIIALALFPLFSKRYSRKSLYTFGTILVVVGYILFFFAPMDIIVIGIAGLVIFFGQAFIQLLMLMFLADTVEYGQWKLGKRNESVTFALQPFINKIGGAIASGIVLATAIISGINSAETVDDVTNEGILIMKVAMLIIPLLFILAGYIVYRTKFKIDDKMYAQILEDLQERGDIHLEENK